MRVVIADGAIHFAKDANAGDALPGALQARDHIRHFLAQCGRAGRLSVSARHHRHAGIRVGEFG